jgi:hypothetical protein
LGAIAGFFVKQRQVLAVAAARFLEEPIPFVIAGVLPLVGYVAVACIAGQIKPVQFDVALIQ